MSMIAGNAYSSFQKKHTAKNELHLDDFYPLYLMTFNLTELST